MSRNFVSSLVQLSLSDDLNINVYLALEKKSTRRAQKLTTLRKYVERYRTGWKRRLELAELLYETGEWLEAASEYKKVIEKQPQRIGPRIQLGKIFQLMFREDEAIAIYEAAIALAKHESTRQHLRGLIASCRKDKMGAIAAFQSAAVLDSHNPTHWLALGKVQMDVESPAAALASFDNILSLDANDFMGLIYSHDLLLILGNLPEAERRLHRALDISPQDIQTLKRVITDRCRKKLVCDMAGKQTRKLINLLLTQASSSPEAHSLLARYHILRGEEKKGLQTIKNFAEEHSNNPQAWYYYSLYLGNLGKQETASDILLKAYQLSGDRCDREIYRALCQALPILGKLEKTRSIMTEMLENFPNCWSLWSIAGRVLVEHIKDNELGCHYALKGTQIQPQFADAWFCYGRVLALAERHEAAIEALTQGWQLLPPDAQYIKSVSAALWVGESYQKLGHYQTGREWLHIACQQAKALMEFNPEKAQYWQDEAVKALDEKSRHTR